MYGLPIDISNLFSDIKRYCPPVSELLWSGDIFISKRNGSFVDPTLWHSVKRSGTPDANSIVIIRHNVNVGQFDTFTGVRMIIISITGSFQLAFTQIRRVEVFFNQGKLITFGNVNGWRLDADYYIDLGEWQQGANWANLYIRKMGILKGKNTGTKRIDYYPMTDNIQIVNNGIDGNFIGTMTPGTDIMPKIDGVLNGGVTLNSSVSITESFSCAGTIVFNGSSKIICNDPIKLTVGGLSIRNSPFVFSVPVDIDFTATGINVQNVSGYSMVGTNTGIFTFKNTDQTISRGAQATSMTFDCKVIVDGITLSMVLITNRYTLFNGLFLTNQLNGTTSSSVAYFDRCDVFYSFSGEPMKIGNMIFNDTSFSYSGGNQEVKGTTYDVLIFSGGGVKKLMGDVNVTGSYSLEAGTTVDLNGYTLTTP